MPHPKPSTGLVALNPHNLQLIAGHLTAAAIDGNLQSLDSRRSLWGWIVSAIQFWLWALPGHCAAHWACSGPVVNVQVVKTSIQTRSGSAIERGEKHGPVLLAQRTHRSAVQDRRDAKLLVLRTGPRAGIPETFLTLSHQRRTPLGVISESRSTNQPGIDSMLMAILVARSSLAATQTISPFFLLANAEHFQAQIQPAR